MNIYRLIISENTDAARRRLKMIRMRLEAKVVCGRGPVSWQQGEMLAMHKIEPLVE